MGRKRRDLPGRYRPWILALLMLADAAVLRGEVQPFNSQGIEPGDAKEVVVAKAANVVPTPRQLAYLQRDFIAFIHWGPCAFTKREWGTGQEAPAIFKPSGLNTDQWCDAMKAAGMKCVVMVVKHHDGFCLWPTRYNRHSVMSSPWREGRGDVLKELVASCRKVGLKVGFYLSPADLYQMEAADGLYGNGSTSKERLIPRPVPGHPFADQRTFKFKVDDYNEYFLNQLFELLTEYGPMEEVWFDGEHPKRKGDQKYAMDAWYQLIRTLAPNAVVFGGPDVRWCGNEGGHTRKAEWNVIPLTVNPAQYREGDFEQTEADLGSRGRWKGAKYFYYLPPEINTSIREGWFYRDEEQGVRSPDEVFDIYERAVGGNGVFMLNIPPNRDGRFSDRDVACLLEVGRRIRETYGKNLNEGVTSSAPQVFDGRPDTFWQPVGETGEIEIQLPAARTVNRVVLQEETARHGQRIEEHALDAWLNSTWHEVARDTTVGYRKILRFAPVTTPRLRIRVLHSRLAPTIAEVSLHYSPPSPPAVAIHRTDAAVSMSLAWPTRFVWNNEDGRTGPPPGAVDAVIRYTTDGSNPSDASARYAEPVTLPWGGTVKARAFIGAEAGPLTESVIGLDSSGWKVVSVSSAQGGHEANLAYDGNPATFWQTAREGGDAGVPRHPHHLAIDLGREAGVTGFTYLPRQDKRVPDGMIEAWRFETSDDGKVWNKATQGEFGNLLNDPSQRVVKFDMPVRCRFVRLVSLRGVRGKPYAGAAEIQVLASP